MSGFFDRMRGRGKDTGSASKARERLKFILVHDRINLPPARLQAMKDEILAVISKYVAISHHEVEIALAPRDRHNSMLIAEIPFTDSIHLPEDSNSSEHYRDAVEVMDDSEKFEEQDEPKPKTEDAISEIPPTERPGSNAETTGEDSD